MMREIKIRAKPDKACFFEPDSVPTRDKERNHRLHGLRGLGFEHEFLRIIHKLKFLVI